MWSDPNSELVKFMKKNIAARQQVKIKMYRDEASLQGMRDELADLRATTTTDRRRMQTIDTSRGYRLYEIPLRPVDPLLHTPVLVPPHRRVLKFT